MHFRHLPIIQIVSLKTAFRLYDMVMEKYTLHQGGITAILSEVAYHRPEGFQEINTWHVTQETISAESGTKLKNGSATIQHGEQTFPVTVTMVELQRSPGEEDGEPEDDEPACRIEIEYVEGLPKLTLALGLLDRLTPKQQQALEG